MSQLTKNLTLWGGTILFLNVVIGAGLLVVPGLAYQQVGNFAILSWLFCSLIAMPLLLVFVILGRNYPDAGGIAHYAKRAFGPWVQKIAAFLLLGAVIFGIPSIAMTAGYYLDSVLPFSVHGYAVLLLLAAVAAHGVGGESLGRILGMIGSSVLVILIALLVVGFLGLGKSSLDHSVANAFVFSGGTLLLSFGPFMMIFFAYTGWEIGAHAAEEFKNPRRDFPWAMFLSFVVATVFYLAIALLIQMSAIKSGFASPFIEVTRPLLGEYGQYAVAAVAALVIYANLFGVVWGVSRLVYSLGRDGILPEFLAKTRGGNPLTAVFAVLICLLASVTLDYLGVLNIQTMLALAGQNFLLLYGLAALALYKLSNQFLYRLLSTVTLVITLVVLFFTNVHIAYPIVIIVLSSLYHLYQNRLGKKA